MFKDSDLEVLKKCYESWNKAADYITFVEGGRSKNDDVTNWIKTLNVRYSLICFNNFEQARNECFKLSFNNCKYQMILDDTYYLNDPELLRNMLSTINKNCIEVYISVNKIKYRSARIIKTNSAKYKGKLHEVINTKTDHVIDPRFTIIDIQNNYNQQRTIDRLAYDLDCVENYKTARDCYFRCMSYYKLMITKRKTIDETINAFNEYLLKFEKLDPESDFVVSNFLGHLHFSNNNNDHGVKSFIKGALLFPIRASEAYYSLFCYTENNKHLDLAIKNISKFNESLIRLPYNTEVIDFIRKLGGPKQEMGGGLD